MTQPTISRGEVERITARAEKIMDDLQYESAADVIASLGAALMRAMGLLADIRDNATRPQLLGHICELLAEWERE